MSNKLAFSLAWEFIKGNWKLTIITIIIEIALMVLGFIPVIGVIFSLLVGLVVFNEQIYFGKLVLNIRDTEGIRQAAQKTELMDFLFKYFNISLGTYLGSLIIFLILGILVFIPMSVGISTDIYGNPHINAIGILGFLVFAIVLSMLGYIYPAVMGEIIKSETFGEAFKKVFLLFNMTLWKKSFNKHYFVFTFLWFLIVLGMVIVSELLIMTVILLPVGMLGMYFMGLYNGAAFVFASEIIESAPQKVQEDNSQTEESQDSKEEEKPQNENEEN